MYTIEVQSVVSNLVQIERFEMYPATSRFNMDSKSPEDSPSIEASPGTNHIFATTHQYYLHPLCTSQFTFTYAHNIHLGSLACSL